jgi:hypothetical protein
MNHFLANLVDRSLGQTAVIQPRPISRFESQAVLPPIDEPEDLAVGDGESILVTTGTKRLLKDHADPTRQHPPQDKAGVPGQTPSTTTNDDPTYLQALFARVDSLSNSLAIDGELYNEAPTSPKASTRTTTRHPQPPEPDLITKMKPAMPGHVIPDTQIDSSTSPAAAPKIARPTRLQPDGRNTTTAKPFLSQRGIDSTSSEQFSPLVETTEQADTTELRLFQPSPANKSQGTASTFLRQLMVSVPSPVARPARQRPPVVPQESHTINVTIGRIEVKATPPPPPAVQKPLKRPPSQTKAISLDEYLRRRNGGSR